MTTAPATVGAVAARPRLGRVLGGVRARARFAVYAAVIVVPLAAGTSAFARYVSERERSERDAELRAAAQIAAEQYELEVRAAAARARVLAREPDIQRALSRRDRRELRRLAAASPGVSFSIGASGAAEPGVPGARRTVEVRAATTLLGRVVATAPLDEPLLARLRRAARLAPDDVLVVSGRGLALAAPPLTADIALAAARAAFDVDVGARAYRAASVPLLDRPAPVRLAVLRPRHRVEAASERVRNDVWLAGAITIAAAALIAYALAPAIARGRLTKQQHAQASRILSQVGDGVVVLDSDGVVRLWNPAAESITSLPADSVVGRPAAEAISGWSAIVERVPVSPAGRERRSAPTAVPLEAAGREVWISASGVESSEGKIYTFRDLTDERRLEKARVDLVSTVSHELRTPLASIYGAAMTLRKRGSLTGDLGDQLLGVITDQSDRLARLVDQIVLAGRLDSGRLEVARRSVDPVALVTGAVDAARSALAPGGSIELIAPATAPEVAADPDRVSQVLANLIDNAAKYSRGPVAVELTVRQRSVRFSVRDQGAGIPAAEHDRIFEKFYRLDPDMTQGVGGSGLGLYICRELVKRMDGRLWVRSRPGEGTTFAFELPVAEEGG